MANRTENNNINDEQIGFMQALNDLAKANEVCDRAIHDATKGRERFQEGIKKNKHMNDACKTALRGSISTLEKIITRFQGEKDDILKLMVDISEHNDNEVFLDTEHKNKMKDLVTDDKKEQWSQDIDKIKLLKKDSRKYVDRGFTYQIKKLYGKHKIKELNNKHRKNHEKIDNLLHIGHLQASKDDLKNARSLCEDIDKSLDKKKNPYVNVKVVKGKISDLNNKLNDLYETHNQNLEEARRNLSNPSPERQLSRSRSI